MPETLTITDNRTGRVRGADRGRRDPRDRAAPDQGRRRRLRPDELRPGVPEHRVGAERDHLHRRRPRHPPLPRLPDRAARGARARTSRPPTCCSSASCRRRTQLARWSTTITHHTFLHETIKQLMEGFRYDAHPMGMFVSAVAALSTFYPEASEVHDPEVRLPQIQPPDRQGADGRGLLVPAQPRPAVRLPRQRPRLRRRTSSR